MSENTSTALYPCISLPPGDYTDIFELQAIRMAVLHNIMIRCINSIVTYAPEVPPAKVQPFIKYCLRFAEFVHTHHGHEEELYFVMLEEKMGSGAMSSNVEGHHAFKEPFKTWEDLCKDIQTGKRSLDVDSFVLSVRAFADILIEHLREEIPTLGAETMRKHLTVEYLQLVEKKILAKVQAEGSLMWEIPLLMVNNEAKTGGWFPPFPGPIRFLVKNVFLPLHSDVWAWGSTDKYGVVKPRFMAAEAA